MFAAISKRCSPADESGFTLVELLVALLIIGILAAIAIPVFLGESNKARDAQAKELARTAQTTAETIALDNKGSYEHVTLAELHSAEPSMPMVAGEKEAYVSAANGTGNEYSVTAKSATGDELTIKRSSSGAVIRECASPVEKTGCAGAASGSW